MFPKQQRGLGSTGIDNDHDEPQPANGRTPDPAKEVLERMGSGSPQGGRPHGNHGGGATMGRHRKRKMQVGRAMVVRAHPGGKPSILLD